MKTKLLKTLSILILFFSCSKTNDIVSPNTGEEIVIKEETIIPNYIKTIDFTAFIDGISEITSFEIKDDYIYFSYDNSIYRINLNSDSIVAEQIIEDTLDIPSTFKIIGNFLYYQGDSTWSLSSDIKQINLNKISEGIQSTTSITGTSRGQLYKNLNKLFYLSSPNGLSPINNFYKFNQSATDQLIATEEFVIPENIRVVDNYLYFSSGKEIRKLDLNTPTKESSIIYTVNNTGTNGNIIGFDIKDNIIYFTQISNNKILSIDLEKLNEAPKTLKINNTEGNTGYGKLIISNRKLYVKKITDKQLEVFDI